jgi:hypothetical protein
VACVKKTDLKYICHLVLIICALYFFGNLSYAYQANATIIFTEKGSFTDNMGHTNVVGTVENENQLPVQVLIGLNATGSPTSTAHTLCYGKIIYPYVEVPFKFRIPSMTGIKIAGEPFVYQVKKIEIPTIMS